MSSDFVIDNFYLEFIGLQGQVKKYDELLARKRSLIQKLKINVIEIFPCDLFPKNQLDKKLSFLIGNKKTCE